MDAIRTFIGIEVSGEVQSKAMRLRERLQKADATVKWVEPHNMHITMNFIGDAPSVTIPKICDAVSDATAQFDPIECEIRGAGAFPRADRPRTVWLGIDQGGDQISKLYRAIRDRLDEIGVYTDRKKFRPHITLGRVRAGGPEQDRLAELIKQNADFEASPMIIDEIIVFSSNLERSGPIYDVMGRCLLGQE